MLQVTAMNVCSTFLKKQLESLLSAAGISSVCVVFVLRNILLGLCCHFSFCFPGFCLQGLGFLLH